MKYLILPVLRFIWGVVHFIWALLSGGLFLIVYILWYFHLPKKENCAQWFEIKNYPGREEPWFSPFPETPVLYKTALHWIFKISIK